MNLKHIKTDLKNSKPRVVFNALRAIGRVSEDERDEALEILEKFLSNGDGMIRYTALLSTIELNGVDKYYDMIIEMVEDSDPKVREVSIIALAQSENKESEKILISLLDSKLPEIRYQVPISIVEKNMDAGKELLERLKVESDIEIKINLITALGDLDYKPALSELKKIANDDIFEIARFEAACAAGRMGEKEVSSILSGFANHSTYGYSACSVLNTLNDKSVIPNLIKQFNKIFLPSKIKLPIAATLANLGDNTGKNFLISKTSSFSVETRILAIDRLGATGCKWAIDPLIKILDRKNLMEKDAALDALINLGIPDSVSHLQKMKDNFEAKSDDEKNFSTELSKVILELKSGDTPKE